MDFIKVDCVTGNTYHGIELKRHRDLPKGVLNRTFSIYYKNYKRGLKYYIIFDKPMFEEK